MIILHPGVNPGQLKAAFVPGGVPVVVVVVVGCQAQMVENKGVVQGVNFLMMMEGGSESYAGQQVTVLPWNISELWPRGVWQEFRICPAPGTAPLTGNNGVSTGSNGSDDIAAQCNDTRIF